MKKIILLALATIFAWTGIAMADTCVLLARNGDPELSPNQANEIERDCTRNNNCDAWWEYDARTRALDIQGIYDASRCDPHPTQDPLSHTITVILVGLDFSTADQWEEEWYEPTGEIDNDGNSITYLKADSRLSLSDAHLTGPVRTLLEENSYLVFNWADVCGYVLNKVSGLVGVECP